MKPCNLLIRASDFRGKMYRRIYVKNEHLKKFIFVQLQIDQNISSLKINLKLSPLIMRAKTTSFTKCVDF